MKVVDASAMVDFLIGNQTAATLAPALDDDLFAPDLMVSELLQTMRRLVRDGWVDTGAADELVQRFGRSPVEYLHAWPYAEQIWAWRHTMSAYDATYVALAADLQATLVTTDLRLARAADGLVPVIAV